MLGKRFRTDQKIWRADPKAESYNGRKQIDTRTPFMISCVVQPSESDNMSSFQLIDTDQKRIEGGIFVYVDPDQVLFLDDNDQSADYIEYNGRVYEFAEKGDFSHRKNSKLSHIKYTAIKTEIEIEDLC